MTVPEKPARNNPPDEPEHNSIVILFSGGLDTSLEVIERLKSYQKIHLITFNNGYCINMQGATRRAEALQQKYGYERITHNFVNTAPTIHKLLKNKHELWEKYRSPLIFDLACKMSSMVELVFYAKQLGITDISDGASKSQQEIFLQRPEFSAHIKPKIAKYGLRLLPSAKFDMDRDSKSDWLESEGFTAGVRSLEKVHISSTLAQQPFCLRGIMTFFFTSPFRHLGVVKHYTLTTERAKEAWDELWPIAKEQLDKKLSEAGLN